MRRATIALGLVLIVAGCGHAAQQPAAKATARPTVDPEIRSLRAQLVRARAERDAALARLHALLARKPAVSRVVIEIPAAGLPHPTGSPQPASRVFSSITTSATVSP